MKTAVISGGAGGLGRALSDALQARGWRMVAIDRDIAGLTKTPTLIPMACDLTDTARRDATCAAILDRFESIDLVIYNAGVTHIGPLEAQTEPALRHVFEVNVFAAAAMARQFLPALRRARGTHLAISSVAGFAPLFHRTAYAASKHALQGFFTSLRSEEAPHGVRVTIAAPSFVATNTDAPTGADGLARPGSAEDGLDPMTPEAAAAAILRGLDRGQTMIPVGRVARMSWLISRLSPRLYQRLMERNIRRR